MIITDMKLTQELFESLENEMNEASERLKNVQSAIKVLQNLCEHEWKESPSHGYASEYYCSICNISKSEIFAKIESGKAGQVNCKLIK